MALRLLVPALLGLCACAPEPAAAASDSRPAVHMLESSERSGGMADDPFAHPRDLSGRSVKTPRVRALAHPADLPGTSSWLIAHDPWLAYARGRELTLREFARADGVFGESGKLDGKALADGVTRITSRDHASSCAMCHNTPWRDAGAGATIAKNAGTGRNTPHAFGGGVLEMLGEQQRLRLYALADRDQSGWIGSDEARGARAVLTEGGHTLDYGCFDDGDGDGRPDLNPICYVWYVDAEGRRIPWARSLRDAGVAGFGFELQVFGFGQRDRLSPGGMFATLRAFTANAFDIHSGMQACDPVLNAEPATDGLARVSVCGAQQFFTGTTRDRGLLRDARGRSRDDPDRDGVLEEITEGDLDLAEWYLLNHPRPAERPSPGREVFLRIGCGRCHVPDWGLEVARETGDQTGRRSGDRRFFDVEVTWHEGRPRGRVVPIARGSARTVRGVYTDLLQHDLGPDCHELQFDGSVQRMFRTAPLWGVGSTAPYGHDGRSLDLEDMIRRHGGEAAAERAAFDALAGPDRAQVLDFLRGLVLYSTDDLACDVDGDGSVAEHFLVAGRDTGVERLNPEWLFRTPGRIEGPVTNVRGERVMSWALENLKQAWGCELPALRDRDRDGWPDRLSR